MARKKIEKKHQKARAAASESRRTQTGEAGDGASKKRSDKDSERTRRDQLSSRAASRPKGRKHPASKKSRVKRAHEVIWLERPGWHRGLIVIAIVVVFALVGLLMGGVFSSAPVSGDEKAVRDLVKRTQEDFAMVQPALDGLHRFLNGGLPDSQEELSAVAASANDWGRALSPLRVTYWSVESPEQLDPFKGFLADSLQYSMEAAENVAMLASSPPEARRSLFDQAKRFYALGDSAEAAGYLGLGQFAGLSRPVDRSEDHPIVVDDVIGGLPDQNPPAPAGEVLASASALSGVPAKKVPTAPSQSVSAWAASADKTVRDMAVTDTARSACGAARDAGRLGEVVPTPLYSDFINKFVTAGNALGAQTPPENFQTAYAAIIRSNRTYAESGVTARLAQTAATDPATKLAYANKLQRLVFMGDVEWQRAVGALGPANIKVAYPELCMGVRVTLMTPWDPGQVVTDTLGPVTG